MTKIDALTMAILLMSYAISKIKTADTMQSIDVQAIENYEEAKAILQRMKIKAFLDTSIGDPK